MIAFLRHLHVLGLQPQEPGRKRKILHKFDQEPSSLVVIGYPWHTLICSPQRRFGGELGGPVPQGYIGHPFLITTLPGHIQDAIVKWQRFVVLQTKIHYWRSQCTSRQRVGPRVALPPESGWTQHESLSGIRTFYFYEVGNLGR